LKYCLGYSAPTKKRRKIVKQKSVRFSAVYPLQQPAVRVVVEEKERKKKRQVKVGATPPPRGGVWWWWKLVDLHRTPGTKPKRREEEGEGMCEKYQK
ncbi:AGAP009401-PA, partial [Anopheles gambiae str. PEST]